MENDIKEKKWDLDFKELKKAAEEILEYEKENDICFIERYYADEEYESRKYKGEICCF